MLSPGSSRSTKKPASAGLFVDVGETGLEPATSRSQSARSKPSELFPEELLEQKDAPV